MRTPALFERVRVSDQSDESIVVQVDPLARVADLCALADKAAIENHVSFNLLFAANGSQNTDVESSNHHDKLAVVQDVLRTTCVHLSRSHHTIADLRDSIDSTLRAIHASRQLIVESDGIIARAQSGPLSNKPNQVCLR